MKQATRTWDLSPCVLSFFVLSEWIGKHFTDWILYLLRATRVQTFLSKTLQLSFICASIFFIFEFSPSKEARFLRAGIINHSLNRFSCVGSLFVHLISQRQVFFYQFAHWIIALFSHNSFRFHFVALLLFVVASLRLSHFLLLEQNVVWEKFERSWPWIWSLFVSLSHNWKTLHYDSFAVGFSFIRSCFRLAFSCRIGMFCPFNIRFKQMHWSRFPWKNSSSCSWIFVLPHPLLRPRFLLNWIWLISFIILKVAGLKQSKLSFSCCWRRWLLVSSFSHRSRDQVLMRVTHLVVAGSCLFLLREACPLHDDSRADESNWDSLLTSPHAFRPYVLPRRLPRFLFRLAAWLWSLLPTICTSGPISAFLPTRG